MTPYDLKFDEINAAARLSRARGILDDAGHNDYSSLMLRVIAVINGLVSSNHLFYMDVAIAILHRFPNIPGFQLSELLWSLETIMPDTLPVEHIHVDYSFFKTLNHCEHHRYNLTQRLISTGIRRALQCQECGTMLSIKMTTEEKEVPFDKLPWFNETLAKEYKAELAAWNRVFSDALYQTKKKWREMWFDWYHSYLDSDEWKAKRQHVLERSQNQCERCGAAASEVHHLSYQQVGQEPLSDLIAICYWCHQREHGREQGAMSFRETSL